MKYITKNIPNALTATNIICGTLSVYYTSEGLYYIAAWLIIIALFCDFFDGLTARLLNAYSDFGKQFDSLADLISFGIAPAFIIYEFFKSSLIINENNLININTINLIYLFSPIIIVLSSAIRLAKFNIDNKQSKSFIGLPTPASAIFIVSFPLILTYQQSLLAMLVLSNKFFLLTVVLFLSIMMIAPIKLFSLKINNLSLKNNLHIYILMIFAIITLIMYKFIAIPFIIIFYILMSVIISIVCPKSYNSNNNCLQEKSEFSQ